MRGVFVCLLALAGSSFAQQPLTAAEIMARVAANQDRAVALRKDYVYQQHVHVVSRMTNGRMMREETSDYDVIPTPDGTDKKLLQRTGRYFHKGKYIEFTGDAPKDDDSIDGDLTHDFANDTTNEKTKNGIGRNLFPLTSERQKEYSFKFLGEGEEDGRPVYHLAFAPADKHDYDWAGEAFIDKQDFEPVYVFTKLNRKLPLLVRGVLGTDLPGIGFSVHYRRQPDGVWFPVSFGTEFRLKVLYFLKRDISLSLENKNFQHTHVDTKITVGNNQ